MNVTDVGHMTTDADEGDDKMQVAAQREGKSPWDIARFYEEAFLATQPASISNAPKSPLVLPSILAR